MNRSLEMWQVSRNAWHGPYWQSTPPSSTTTQPQMSVTYIEPWMQTVSQWGDPRVLLLSNNVLQQPKRQQPPPPLQQEQQQHLLPQLVTSNNLSWCSGMIKIWKVPHSHHEHEHFRCHVPWWFDPGRGILLFPLHWFDIALFRGSQVLWRSGQHLGWGQCSVYFII